MVRTKNSPQMSGTHVTGLVSCTRILNLSVSSAAPFIPSIWRAALSLSVLASVASLTALRGAARRAVLWGLSF
jgi:hypothetical protein